MRQLTFEETGLVCGGSDKEMAGAVVKTVAEAVAIAVFGVPALGVIVFAEVFFHADPAY